MYLTKDNIFHTICTDYEKQLHVPLSFTTKDKQAITHLCTRYKNNYELIREMWNQYINEEFDGKWGLSIEYFLTPQRLNKYAQRAYHALHTTERPTDSAQYDNVGHYKCETPGCLWTPRECIVMPKGETPPEYMKKPCPICGGRCKRERI